MIKIPGFIDIQVNGYNGIDFSSPALKVEDMPRIANVLTSHGTAAFLPTIITSSKDLFLRNLRLISKALDRFQLHRRIPGIHIEGPFISPEEGARGAHPRKHVIPADTQFLSELIDASEGNIRLLTIAAEVEGAEEICSYAQERNIAVALGHQLASNDRIDRLVNAGAKLATHLGNGIPTLIHRFDNTLFSILANENIYASIIADGHHLSSTLLKIIYKMKQAEKLVAVSDSAPIAGLAPGRYAIFESEVDLLPEGKIVSRGTDYLAGSSNNLLQCMNYLAALPYTTFDDLVKISWQNPLKMIDLQPDEVDPLHHVFFNTETNQFELIR